jgi:DNA-binding transcriptional LysR family regulator
MSKQHLDKEDRREQQCRRLGTHEPDCVVCGETDPRCLEKHHLAGEKYADDLVTVCRNCHRKLSDDQLDHAPECQPVPESKEAIIGHFLHGLCDFLLMVVERLREFADWLIRQSCDADAPA